MNNILAYKQNERDAQETLKYLPPYSPDLNPIEQVFAKVKALLRQAAERTVDQLWQTLGTVPDEVQYEECRN